MTRSIAEWQRLTHALARERGEHSRACVGRKGTDAKPDCGPYCGLCNGTGCVEVDHKSPTRIASRLALIHLAISRAVECVVKGEMDITMTKCLGRLRGNSNGSFGLDCLTLKQCLTDGWQPRGFPIALADVFLRLCDLAEGLGVTLEDDAPDAGPLNPKVPEDYLEILNDLHWMLSEWTGEPEATTEENGWAVGLSHVLIGLRRIAVACGVDLFAMAELKHAWVARELRPKEANPSAGI